MLAALDFGEETVSVLVAEQKEGRHRVLSLGETPARGIRGGRVENVGDAAECIAASVRSAEENSGVLIRSLYYNFFDPDLESVVSRGSKILKGEGQIRDSDLKEVRQIAERTVGHFEKSIVYARESGYTIDDRDFLINPLGIFGRKIDVEMRILLAVSAHCDAWQRITARAGIQRAVPVAASWSAAYGTLPREDRRRPRLLVVVDRDHLNIFIFGNNMITDHRVLAFEPGQSAPEKQAQAFEAVREWATSDRMTFDQILLTGHPFLNVQSLREWQERLGKQVTQAGPTAVAGLEDPRRTKLVGLLLVADELESSSPILHKEKGIFPGVKKRAASFFSDYF